MAHRKVRDRYGHEWDVWEVNPAAADRRARELNPTVERRRKDAGLMGRLSDRLRDGWLAFQSAQEKRRLAPIPDGWESLSDAEILMLLDRAQRAGRPTRLIE
jgi:hypothetical protein